jgi:hypothetical protein
MVTDAKADSIAIPNGGEDIAQPPPNVSWVLKRIFAPSKIETKISDGTDSHTIRSGQISDEIPLTDTIHIKFDNSDYCNSRTVFYHALEL